MGQQPADLEISRASSPAPRALKQGGGPGRSRTQAARLASLIARTEGIETSASANGSASRNRELASLIARTEGIET